VLEHLRAKLSLDDSILEGLKTAISAYNKQFAETHSKAH